MGSEICRGGIRSLSVLELESDFQYAWTKNELHKMVGGDPRSLWHVALICIFPH